MTGKLTLMTGPANKKKKRKQRKLNFRTFLEESSAHGLKHIVNKKECFLHRLAWTWFCMMTMGLSIYFIYRVYVQWQNSPLIVAFGEQLIHISQISFPAITICNINQVSSRKLDFFMEANKRINGPIIDKRIWSKIFTTVLNMDVAIKQKDYSLTLHNILLLNNMTVEDIIEKAQTVVPSCNEFLLHCQWKSSVLPCEKLFNEYFTKYGLCCVFNSAFYEENSNGSFKAENASRPGIDNGLSLILDSNLDDYFGATEDCNGFKFFISHPWDPVSSSRSQILSPGKEALASLNSVVVQTRQRVSDAGYGPDEMRCYFDYFILKHVRVYSVPSCLLECTLEKTQACGCRPFTVPRLIQEDREQCKCMPNCDDLTYQTTLTYSSFPLSSSSSILENGISNGMKHKINTSETHLRENLAKLTVFFNHDYVDTRWRDLRFGWQDFIASCGGLLGFASGISIISCIELLFFCLSCK
ncbi:pickpocket protein 28-like isoform X2 [Artemia franciscana]|uniref:pickpocket protein 28-like isoform X2 n=1 Tax=Artemia franciscana TaxID=6661 RepID=UPI0032DBC5CC